MKIKREFLFIAITGLLFLLPLLGAEKGGLAVLSEGEGKVKLLWLPPRGQWPEGGWRVEDASGRVLGVVKPGDPGALEPLTPGQRERWERVKPFFGSQRERTQVAEDMVRLIAVTDFSLAKAFAMAWQGGGLSPGSRSFRVVALNGKGDPLPTVLSSPPVDPSLPDPPLGAPVRLRTLQENEGMVLYWGKGEGKPLFYRIERSDPSGRRALLTEQPLFLGVGWKETLPAYVDRKGLSGGTNTYRVWGVDLFGRSGDSSECKGEYVPPETWLPPLSVDAKGEGGRVVLRWRMGENSRVSTVVVERAMLPEGPFETLTPKGVPPQPSLFEDRGVKGGVSYFYRVRSVSGGGDLGVPSDTAMVKVVGSGQLPRIEGLKADLGRTRIRLTWNPAADTAGYLVERKSLGGDWARLNTEIFPKTLLDDPILTEGEAVTFSYRVSGVSLDGTVGKPSSEVVVNVPSRLKVGAPILERVEALEGKVKIHFRHPPSGVPVSGYLLLRSSSPEEEGLVVGEALPPQAVVFTDGWVKPGETYWYRVVALDGNGGRGPLSQAFPGQPLALHIPVPSAPRGEFKSAPFPRVVLTLPPGMESFTLVLERRIDGEGSWTTIAESLVGESFVDSHPPRGEVNFFYRLLYLDAQGVRGEASPILTIRRP